MSTHGHTKGGKFTKEYAAWANMHARCYRRSSPMYHRYGGRGIAVCKRWHSFENFLSDMGEKPQGKSLERINNDRNYSPKNCRWATSIEQNSNKSSNRFFTYNGTTMTVAAWAKKLGIHPTTLAARLRRYGQEDIDKVVAKQGLNKRLISYQGQTQSLVDWAKAIGISREALSQRINAYGWSLERALVP